MVGVSASVRRLLVAWKQQRVASGGSIDDVAIRIDIRERVSACTYREEE